MGLNWCVFITSSGLAVSPEVGWDAEEHQMLDFLGSSRRQIRNADTSGSHTRSNSDQWEYFSFSCFFFFKF